MDRFPRKPKIEFSKNSQKASKTAISEKLSTEQQKHFFLSEAKIQLLSRAHCKENKHREQNQLPQFVLLNKAKWPKSH